MLRCVLGLGILVSGGIVLSAASGQDSTASASEYTIKAAYIYNFLRYIEWPTEAFENADSPFVVGVLGEVPSDLQRSFAYYERSKTVRGRPIRFRHFQSVEEITDCHIVFLTNQPDSRLLQETVQHLREDHTLLVGDMNGFLQYGGEVNFVVVSNKVRIQLDLNKTKRKGLKPSAKLLQVAQLVEY